MQRRRRGMTLVEIMVVMTILVLISSAIAIGALEHQKTARVMRAKADLEAIHQALDLYQVQHGRYPDPAPGLAALAKPLKLRHIEDPWGRVYLYELRESEPLLTTLGADGEPGGSDDAADLTLGEASP